MKPIRLTALLILFSLFGLAAKPALAGSARVEYVRLTQAGSGGGDAPLQPEALFGTPEVVATNTGGAVQSAAAPQVTDRLGRPITGLARVVALSGSLIVTNVGTALTTNGWRVPEGREAFIPVPAGGHLSILEDPTVAVALATAANQATANSSLSTISSNTAAADATCIGTASSAAALTWTGPAGVCNGLAYIEPGVYAAASIQVVANAGNNTLRLRGSNDGGTTLSTLNVRASNVTATAGCAGSTFNTATVTYFPCVPVMGRLVIDVATWVSGSVTLAVNLRRAAPNGTLDVNVGNAALTVNEKPASTGGLTVFRIATGASGPGKSGSAQLFSYDMLNTTASVRYLQFCNKATACIPGTDASIYTAPLAANGRTALSPPAGLTIGTTGCSWAITTDAAGATIATSGDVVGAFATN